MSHAIKNEVNPCEHRAQLWLKHTLNHPKKGKKRDRRIFSFEHIIKNFDSVPVLRGVDFLGFFAYVSLPEKLFRN